ncbi:uncharacterized protein A4U43_C03F3950 [Asparagus officinalis]|uniref:Phosphoglycerate mutase-like protein 4 n=1 Tax=Asparagus officinalis TaxID=4686 RepID=A0A5P1F7P6_ASPOF|nr:phosphoglycerate mutase-like protein 4 [Asparagus officinalis]ONK74212.1 uncharacterized protein A4U43_C03F3950 [Asparagus officinalis]
MLLVNGGSPVIWSPSRRQHISRLHQPHSFYHFPLRSQTLTLAVAKIAMSSPPIDDAAAGTTIPPGFAEIVVVRHGETSWNASKIIQGHMDSELNENGRKQASAVAVRLSNEPTFAAIYSSDLKRASETAQIIATTCNLSEVITDTALRERNIGDIQGLTLRDAAKLKPVAYKIFMSHDRDKEIPGGGESHNQLYERCTSALERIARKHIGERVIVVTHGGVTRELYRRARPNCSPHGRIQNTAMSIFLVSENGENWMLKVWGDVSHLEEIGVLEDSFGGDRNSA